MDINALPILQYDALCHKVGIDPDLKPWRSIAGLDDHVFNVLIREAWVRYCESVQLAPASEAHHHAGPGGLLIHTYEVITLALKHRRGLQLPVGGSISVINEKRHLWTYGVFAACLLHDIGKLSSSIRIQLNLRDGSTRFWNPHDEPLTKFAQAQSYSIAFIKTPYAYHTYISLSFFDLLPRVARAWIADELELMKQICAHLRGDRYESGVIGEIVEQADMKSTAADLQLPASTQRFSNTIPVIDRFMGFIRAWVREGEVKVNVNGGMGWVDNDGYVYFVCRSLAQRIIDECADKGINDVPRDHVRIYDILQDHGYAIPTEDGKAIWTIAVKGDGFSHRFTCLKFEARRIRVPTRAMAPFSGEIIVEDGSKRPPQSAAATPEPASTGTGEKSMEETPATAETATPASGTSSEDAAERIHEDANAQAGAENQHSNGGGNTQEAATNGAEVKQEAEEAEDKTAGSLVFAAARRTKEAGAREKTPKTAEAVETQSATEEKTQAADAANKAQAPAAESAEKPQETGEKPREPGELPRETADVPPEPAEIPIKDTVDDIVEEHAEEPSAAAEKIDSTAPQNSSEKLTSAPTGEAQPAKPEASAKTNENAATAKDAPPLYHGITIDTPDIQHKFMNWLRNGLIEQTIPINNPAARVHIVKEGVLLLAPAIFKDFCVKHSMPEEDHRRLSKKFDRLKKNIKSEQGLNIHTYWAKSKNRAGKISGRLLPFDVIYEHGYPVPKPNKYIVKDLADKSGDEK